RRMLSPLPFMAGHIPRRKSNTTIVEGARSKDRNVSKRNTHNVLMPASRSAVLCWMARQANIISVLQDDRTTSATPHRETSAGTRPSIPAKWSVSRKHHGRPFCWTGALDDDRQWKHWGTALRVD